MNQYIEDALENAKNAVALLTEIRYVEPLVCSLALSRAEDMLNTAAGDVEAAARGDK